MVDEKNKTAHLRCKGLLCEHHCVKLCKDDDILKIAKKIKKEMKKKYKSKFNKKLKKLKIDTEKI